MKEIEMFKEIRAMDNTPEDYMKFKGMVDDYAAKDDNGVLAYIALCFIMGIILGYQICLILNP